MFRYKRYRNIGVNVFTVSFSAKPEVIMLVVVEVMVEVMVMMMTVMSPESSRVQSYCLHYTPSVPEMNLDSLPAYLQTP